MRTVRCSLVPSTTSDSHRKLRLVPWPGLSRRILHLRLALFLEDVETPPHRKVEPLVPLQRVRRAECIGWQLLDQQIGRNATGSDALGQYDSASSDALNISRLNLGWYTLGTTYQLMIALGLHSSRSSTGGQQDCTVRECKKRCYWIAFTIDTYFSVILGRPPLMSEQWVDQSSPAMANDENITASTINHAPVVRDRVQAAPIFHTRLAKIIRDAGPSDGLLRMLQ